ncbi:MAG: helix-turn-helix domain-containing protein [Pseudonocardiaceae bacterium]|nr:helix-turn-helix domain-containing protein [Pseudonocardiaceae bacterium]
MGTDDGEQSSGSAALRIILGAQLRKLREAAEISRAQAGYQIRGSESKISRMELGRVGFKPRDIADLLTMYGVCDPGERSNFLDQVAQSNQPGWWQRYGDLMPRWLDNYLGLEESASRIQTYELQFVPGLLQTEAYARAVIGQGMPESLRDDVERRVALRMRRQKVLARPTAPQLWTIIDESVLVRKIGGREVLLEQIDKLLELTTMPHITLQVVGLDITGYAAESPFTLLRFAEPELSNIVYIEYLSGALYLEKPDEIETFGRALDRLAVAAETPEHSRQLLKKRRAEL